MVVLQGVSPESVQALRALRLPVGLMFIKVSGARLANLMRDGLSPGKTGVATRIGVENINQEGQLIHRGARLQGIDTLFRHETGCVCLWQLSQRLRQICSANSPLAPGSQLLISGWKNLDASKHSHPRSHPTHGHPDTRPVRINGNGAVKRPCRSNHPAGLVTGLLNLSMQFLNTGAGRSRARRPWL